MRVLNIGSMNLDYVYQVDHIVQPGETEATGERAVHLGGKGMNQTVALAKAGVDVYHGGMIGEDAWYVVDKYLDDAVLAGVPSVRIIHGKGTGALRAALWKYFKTDSRIKSYRHGNYGEGDAGVTVIQFKE